MKRAPPSLQQRALSWLAQREQSRSELRRKLLRAARGQLVQTARASDADAGTLDEQADAGAAAEQEVERLLDALEGRGLLSEARFVESRVRVRAAGLGTRRIEMELAQHGLRLDARSLRQLRDTELQRAQALRQRRYGALPTEAQERARQMRFLAGRGFSSAVVRRVLAGADDREGDAPG